MNIKQYEDYETMSIAGAEYLLDLIIKNPYANICLAIAIHHEECMKY